MRETPTEGSYRHHSGHITTLNPIPTHPIMFNEVNGLTILRAALSTKGSAGPSGADAFWNEQHILFHKHLWKRMWCLFQEASTALRETL